MASVIFDSVMTRQSQDKISNRVEFFCKKCHDMPLKCVVDHRPKLLRVLFNVLRDSEDNHSVSALPLGTFGLGLVGRNVRDPGGSKKN